MYNRLLSLILLIHVTFSYAQNIPNYSPNEILLNMKKLNVLGSVLYVAAHPDDENTVMLSWLAKEKMVRTSYLSITRGDGGQNLIGAEQSELLGLIRTHELLTARAIDGPEQYFTSAADFGFSKNTEETLKIWDEKAVLGDVVWRIRNLKPDIIICRFPPDQRAGHGNHSASAVLAEKAFKLSADPNAYPEQLKFVETWQAKRIVWNTFNFGGPTQIPNEKEYLKVDIGGFNALLGQSYPEIAAESRSQHKSQGFGVPRRRGSSMEFFVHKDGEKAINDVFEGVDLSWKKVTRSWGIESEVKSMISEFNMEKPGNSLPKLISIYQKIQNLENGYWKTQKTKEIKELIKLCAGLFMEANSSEAIIGAGEPIKLSFSSISRTGAKINMHSFKLSELAVDTIFNDKPLADNILQKFDFIRNTNKNTKITQPYWLEKPKINIGRYNQAMEVKAGDAIGPASFTGIVTLNILGEKVDYEIPVTYKYTDEIRGELYRPLEIRPAITVDFTEKVFVFPAEKSKKVEVKINSFSGKKSGNVSLTLPEGWRAAPSSIPFNFEKNVNEQIVNFEIFPSQKNSEGIIKAIAISGSDSFTKGYTEIKYDHIPPLIKYHEAEAKVVRNDIKITAKNIGYIVGAGDEVPKALSQIGAKVTILDDATILGNLNQYDAIVIGIRAYNVNKRMNIYNPLLLNYVKNGGNLIVQYQVNNFLQKLDGGIGPYPFKLSRDRVTVEEAEIRMLKPEHPLLNTPNKISAKDFEGWVQERGLYFSNEWDPKYEAILSTNDPGEKPMDGGLLYAQYGKGSFIFTGYAFFRQLPAGVNGAYKLFANLVSVKKK